MADEDQRFIPRPIAALTGICAVVTALAIGIFAFLLPANRVRRDYAPSECTVISALIACRGECRNATVTSPDFEGRATIFLDGRGSAPCSTIASCDESFSCRYRVEQNGVAVREDISAFPLGMILFLALAGVITLGLLVYLVHDILRHFGIDLTSSSTLRVVLFVPAGADGNALAAEVTARWPRVEARGLSYRTYIQEEDKVAVAARRTFTTPAKSGATGLVFIVTADGRNEKAVLNAVPDSFYRVLVLPSLEDCLQNRSVTTASARLGQETRNVEEVLVGAISSKVDSTTAASEIEAAHESLVAMAADFDSVYTVGTLEFGNHAWVAMRALRPYIPIRTMIVSYCERIRGKLGRLGQRLTHVICCRCGSENDRSESSVAPKL